MLIIFTLHDLGIQMILFAYLHCSKIMDQRNTREEETDNCSDTGERCGTEVKEMIVMLEVNRQVMLCFGG